MQEVVLILIGGIFSARSISSGGIFLHQLGFLHPLGERAKILQDSHQKRKKMIVILKNL